MPRPSKRAIASRSAAAVSAVKRQRTRTRNNATGELRVHDSRSSEEASRSCEEEESDDDEVELSDAEDLMLPVMQPESGWADAERKCYGYSKTNAGKSPQSKWYYNKKKKELEHEKEVAQKTYGSISRYFASMSPSPLPVRESEDSAIEEAGDFLHLQPVSETNDGLLPTEVFRTTALDFEGTFFRSDAFEQEIEELDLWLKRSNLKAQVAGDWLKRVTGVRDLLRFQGSWIYLKEDNPTLRKRRWIEYSEVIAVRLEKGPKYAQFLRKWQRDWFDLRIPPPCPMKGKHVKRRSLYNDEGVPFSPVFYTGPDSNS